MKVDLEIVWSTVRPLLVLWICGWNLSVTVGWAVSCRGAADHSEVRRRAKWQSEEWFPCHTGFSLSLFSWILIDPHCCCGLKLPWERDKSLLWILQWVVGLKVVGKTESSQDVGEWDIHEECSPHPTAEHLTAVRALQYFLQHYWDTVKPNRDQSRSLSQMWTAGRASSIILYVYVNVSWTWQ